MAELDISEELRKIDRALVQAQDRIRHLRRELGILEDMARPLPVLSIPATASKRHLIIPTEAERLEATHWLRTKDVAQLYGVSQPSIGIWVRKGRLRGLVRQWTLGLAPYRLIDPRDLWQDQETTEQ